ncbi:MAG: hypothetical protein M3033_03405 [Acidobacteriota bacterium]|nr:hypothetical protein [Acidobacteriota bacterium]
MLLNINDFAGLQSQSDRALGLNSQGHELTAAERSRLQNFSVLNGTVGENRLVKVTGYLARGLDPHPNTGESVNCRFTEPQNNDFHITLSDAPQISTFQGIKDFLKFGSVLIL